MIKVAQLGQVFVKATRFQHPESVEIDRSGIRHDRDFALVEANNGFVSSERHGDFFPLSFDFDAANDSLSLTLPDGLVIQGPAAATGPSWDYNHFTIRTFTVSEVEGPWAKVLSDFAGRPIRLVRCLSSGTAIDILPVTFVTTGSLRRLSRELGAPVEAARFRAGLVLDNVIEHEEDGWDGRLIRIGAATLKVRSAVPRCQITGMDPLGGARDLDVMKTLVRYREKQAYPDGLLAGYETPGFATYAEVIEPGTVRLGDTVILLS